MTRTKPTSSNPATPSDDQQKSIIEALNEKLPVFPNGAGSHFTDDEFHTISGSSGRSTKIAVPPMAWVAEDMESYLKTYFTGEIEGLSVPGRAPIVEQSFILSNEADVVRASAVYLLNVVHTAGESFFLNCVMS